MYPAKFDYYRAGSVSEALSLIREHRGAKFLAGGHSLIPVMKLRLADLDTLIDIGRIAELKGISAQNDSVRIGALTTHAMVAASDVVPKAMSEGAGWMGDPQVRNRGTVGGNVAHADPASDLPTVLTALGATFHIRGANGDRIVGASDFFVGFFETALNEDEILTAIEVPIHGAGTGSAYTKLSHPASGYAIVGAAAVVTVAGGQCASANVAVGGLTNRATKTPSVGAALVSKTLDANTIASAADTVLNDLGGDILGDMHAGAEYRKAMAKVHVKRAIATAVERA